MAKNNSFLSIYNKSRKGKSKKGFKRFYYWSKNTVYLIAHALFDGELTKYSCIYNNSNRRLIEFFKECMKKIYTYEPIEIMNGLVIRISYHNVALSNYLTKKGTLLLKDITFIKKSHRLAFTKAFFDDEGCMDFHNNIRRIRGYQYNIKILYIIQNILLTDFNITSHVYEQNHEIVITSKENILRFAHYINFSKGIYINGNRKNSRWKQHLEKREILDRAIKSYK